VSITFADVAWSGMLLGVGRDVARVGAGDAEVDVRIADDAPFTLRTHAAGGDGHRGNDSISSFTARLRELDGPLACIGTSVGVIEGSLRTGRDQVRLTDRGGDTTYVPAASVWWVRSLDGD